MLLLGDVEPPTHLSLHGPDSGTGSSQPLSAQGGELDGKDPASGWLFGPGDESIPFEGLQEDVHRLSGYEGAAGQVRVGETGSLSEELKTRVLRHRHPQWTKRSIHLGPQHTVRLFEEIAQGGVQVQSDAVLTHVNILT